MLQNQKGTSRQVFVVILYEATKLTHYVDIFRDVSYTTPSILARPKWLGAQVLEKPKAYRNKVLIAKEWDNVFDLEVRPNPRILREGAYEPMKRNTEACKIGP